MVIDEETYKRNFMARNQSLGMMQYTTSTDEAYVTVRKQETVKESPYKTSLKKLFTELDRLDSHADMLTKHLSKVLPSDLVVETPDTMKHENSVPLLADMDAITRRIERVTNNLLFLNEQIVL